MNDKPEPHIVEVPNKQENETYEQKQYRVSCHNSNFMIRIESRVAQWSKTHRGKHPPIVKDEEGKFYWVTRKLRRKQQSNKFINKNKKK